VIGTDTRRRVALTADEVDVVGAHGHHRRVYPCLQRAGVTAATKRRMRRRERREGRAEAQEARHVR
jgi:hypothetical protein